MLHKQINTLFVVAALFVGVGHATAAERLKPFELASTDANGDLAQITAQVKQKLTANGFTIVGSYAPYTDMKLPSGAVVSADVIGVTNAALKQAASQTDFGGYAAVQRVTVTKVNNQVQVSFTNPVYMANAYRLKNNLEGVDAQLKKALGSEEAYGSSKGLTPSGLRDYHYKFMMPYFTDPDTLAEYGSYQEALNAVNAGLAAHNGGTTKVYQVAIPGKDETLFGVALSGKGDACSGDAHIMSKIDFKDIKSTGHLPYDILVSGGKVYALGAKFRIAINFPDLSMMGNNSFMSIMCAPGAIEKSLKEAAKGA
ncbi:MAG: hypothetical protein V4563_04240 [Pseudomonadota bacterium]